MRWCKSLANWETKALLFAASDMHGCKKAQRTACWSMASELHQVEGLEGEQQNKAFESHKEGAEEAEKKRGSWGAVSHCCMQFVWGLVLIWKRLIWNGIVCYTRRHANCVSNLGNQRSDCRFLDELDFEVIKWNAIDERNAVRWHAI